ncbi:DUF305 domain-containing protein [Mycolicibacterium setense]|uniref:DUF305 domain-containing protein n=1 Tax=Mycolicibacterium setense TaxID=431269 RepID=UPI0012FF3ED4|nr:DUF305 domain-containing protein [Mycolicibacterium setense]
MLLVIPTVVAIVVMHHNSAPATKPMLSPVDIGFAQDMSVHHQQAVTLADMLDPAVDHDVRALADQIRTKQIYEIGQLAGWLQAADAPPVAAHSMAWMSASGGDSDSASRHGGHAQTMAMPGMQSDVMLMPGMASQADLVRLQRLKGPDNEILFLQLMFRHHQGGIDMAMYAFNHTTTRFVRQAALAMARDQGEECALMTSIMSRINASPLTYP